MFGSAEIVYALLNSYADALNYYNAMEPWRGETADGAERPLRNRRRRSTGVRKLDDGSIAFRLHRTDVVTFHPDNTIVLRIYESMTTAQFITAHCPMHITAFLSRRGPGYICVGDNFYRACDGDVLTIRGNEVTGASPWRWPRLDRKAANAFRREAGIDRVRRWLHAAQAMGFNVFERKWAHVNELDRIIADSARWPELLNLGGLKAVERYERAYLRDHCLIVTERPCLRSWREVYACRAALRKWGL